jgi:hypothetical protein
VTFWTPSGRAMRLQKQKKNIIEQMHQSEVFALVLDNFIPD